MKTQGMRMLTSWKNKYIYKFLTRGILIPIKNLYLRRRDKEKRKEKDFFSIVLRSYLA